MQDLTGKKFNKLTVLREDAEHNKDKDYKKWICKCDCGCEKSVGAAHLKNGQIKSCGCLQRRKGSEHPLFNGAGKITGSFWFNRVMRRTKTSATHRALEVTITPEYAWKIFLKQKEKCAFTGLHLKFPEHGKDNTWTASLDRIDSDKGYIEGNVQWVHKHINKMKNNFKDEYFINMCKLVSDSCTI